LKKVLYITYDGLTDPLGQSQILPYLQQLTKEGYQFTILSFEKRARFQKEAAVVQSIVDTAGIQWVPLFFTARPPIISKMYDRYRMWQSAQSLHKKQRFDMVHCRSYIAAEMGLRLKQKFGVRLLFDMRGFWADEKVDNGQWNLAKPLYRRIYQFYKQKEKDFLLQADGIVSLTQAAKDYLLQKEEYQELSIQVIPCCADLQHFDYTRVQPEQVKGVKEKLGIPDGTKVIAYLGSIGGWYMTREMFRFFAVLQKLYPQYRMLILTKDDPAIVKREAAEAGIPAEKVFVTYSSRAELPAYLALCSCSIFFIRNTFSKTASSPTKHAELMGMGIPVICNDIGDTGNIITATQTGMVINEFDEATLRQAVLEIPLLEQLDKELIRHHAQEIFDLQSGVKRYSDVYRHVLENKKAIA
jgi:glycosyltransferase involved in cell wall biosynthesis